MVGSGPFCSLLLNSAWIIGYNWGNAGFMALVIWTIGVKQGITDMPSFVNFI